MKKILSMVLCLMLSLVMVAGCFVSCGEKNYAENNTKIKIGASGPLTGGAAMYGIAVQNSAMLAVKEINAIEAAGGEGTLGIQFEFVMLDDKHDPNNIAMNYASLYEGGMQVSLGTVTTKPGLEFKGYANADNVFFLTPSASGDAIPEFANGYQMCFADSDQGTASAGVFNAQYKGKTVGVFYKADDDYSVGIKNNFVKALDSSFGTPVEASFTGDASMFDTQISILKDCDVIFMPFYYTEAGLVAKAAQLLFQFDGGCPVLFSLVVQELHS